MLEFSQDCPVYIACGTTDLRKSFHALAAIVKLKFNLDPYSRCMFAFCNRSRTLLKILRWDGSGFWLLMKRIDKGNFRWPDTPDQLRQISLKELRWLSEGLALEQKTAFKERHPKIII
jgi:transposase